MCPSGRGDPRALVDWRQHTDAWETVPLSLHDADGLAASMARVAEVDRVTPKRQRHWVFGKVTVAQTKACSVPMASSRCPLAPRAHQHRASSAQTGVGDFGHTWAQRHWREPELTVSLLPQAHCIVFILGADTGVTQSDLRIWREHITSTVATPAGRLVVLNKIDTLWDELSTPDAVQRQIQQQCENSAAILAVAPSRVIAVSAQKGLVAKIHGDDQLLQASHLPDLENALVHDVIGQRRQLLQQAVAQGVNELVARAGRSPNTRPRPHRTGAGTGGFAWQNGAVIRHMRQRIEQEQHDFEAGSGAYRRCEQCT